MRCVGLVYSYHHKHHQSYNEADDDCYLTAHAAFLYDLRQLSLRCSQPGGCAIDILLQLLQHLPLSVQLFANRKAHVSQASNTLTQLVEVFILPPAGMAQTMTRGMPGARRA